MSRYRDPQLQVGANPSYLCILRPNIYSSWCLNTYFVPDNSDELIQTDYMTTVAVCRALKVTITL